MRATRCRKRLPLGLLIGAWFVGTVPALFAQASPPTEKPGSHPITVRSPGEFLTSPRETLKTLYFAVVAYDLQPPLMEEAVACLDLDPARAANPTEAARLAIELEQTLRILCIPLHGVPEKTERDTVAIVDTEGFKIAVARGADGLWRFDRETVERIPAMNRASLARFRDMQAERTALKDEHTDASATMRRFLMDTIAKDFYAAARCLDLSTVPPEERGDKGPLLARELAFVMQRRSWVFMQEVPNHPCGPPFTWHADKSGRIVLERVRMEDGKEAWLFSKKTVRNIPAMFEQAREQPADPRYVRLGVALPSLTAADLSLSRRPPPSVPAHLGSPRALLEGFFRTMDAAEARDARLVDALEYLDVEGIPQADRRVQGTKLATKLEAVLRKIRVELSALPDDWNAPMQVLGESQGVRVEIVRQRDGSWRFSRNTVNQVPAFLDKLAVQDRTEHERAAHLDSARDTMSTFLTSIRQHDYDQADDCLDLSCYRSGTQDEVGPALAYKLKYVIDRIGRVYIQEVPDTPDGARYVFYRGDLGRIVIARKADGPRQGNWLFTPETVALIEPMFRGVLNQPVNEASADSALPPPSFWHTPGLWIRFRVPDSLRMIVWRLQLYQWLGLGLAVLASMLVARLCLGQFQFFFAFILRKCGSALSRQFVAAKLRPLTWVAAWWLLFQVLELLDLPLRFVDALQPFKTLGMAGLIAWLGLRIVDLATGVYMNSELLRPHRSLSDMVVPVAMRSLKGGILLLLAVYIVYQIGEGDSLTRFLTGLGLAGLAVSLAAQDALKSFFSTLLLIGERSFKIGDTITVGNQQGEVEQVGFRATRLRTADGSLLTIPNATIASVPIDNLSTKAFSRCKASLLVNYDTAPERILELRDRIRAWLLQHPKVRPDKVDVSVNRLTDKGVEVTLDLYLAEVSRDGELDLKEEINCEVLRLCGGLAAGEDGVQHPLSSAEKARGGLRATRGAA
jgi:MscS family membrane protein